MTFAEQIAARTLWQEARGEPEEGQRAVAHVIVNRIKDGRWGKSLASVCLARAQFSGWNQSDPNRVASCILADDDPALEEFCGMIRQAQSGEDDPTYGSTHYYSTSVIIPPDWAATGEFVVQIGHHRFYRNVK